MRKISKVGSFKQILQNMGWRYVSYRGTFELKKKLGLLKKKFPLNPPAVNHITLEDWRRNKKPFFNPFMAHDIEGNIQIHEDANRIVKGKIKFFSNEWFDLGNEYDWITNPDTGFRYDISSHWIDINDYSKDAGDIKYVWEKSRFSFIYTLIRDEHWNKNQHAAFIFSEIDNWMDHNPINQGPNYKCSQEISLRVLNWIFALYYYSDSRELSEERWNKIMYFLYWQIAHVYANIDFSRKAVRNNHAITETLTLYLVGLLFPGFKDSEKWKTNGKRWFEEEIKYQIYEDGTFLQFSMNYHRVVIQLLTWAIGLSELNKDRFTKVVYERAYSSLNFLFQCQEGKQGELPNYGANDGALFFPLNVCGYRDFRPQLNALHELLCGQSLYEKQGEWMEDAIWYGRISCAGSMVFPPLKKATGCISFPVGGYYLIRDSNSFTFIRCGNHKDRPSQADNLHIDVWVDGENMLIDGGSYKYNADDATLKYFMGTASHNTVMLDDNDQMLKGGRFIWYYWSQTASLPQLSDEDQYFSFEGAVKGFGYLNKRIVHKRKIRKQKGINYWVIEDSIINKPTDKKMVVLWHYRPFQEPRIDIKAITEGEDVTMQRSDGWYSGFYGAKEKSAILRYPVNGNIITTTLLINDTSA